MKVIAPWLSVEHLDYLIQQLPAFEQPLSPAMESLKFQRSIQSVSPSHKSTSSSDPSVNNRKSKSSRGDKQVSTIGDDSPWPKKKIHVTRNSPAKEAPVIPSKENLSIEKTVPNIAWTTIDAPSPSHDVASLLASLSNISADHLQTNFEHFLDLLKSRQSAASHHHTPMTLYNLLHQCKSLRSENAINDVFHMVSLIQLVFLLEYYVNTITSAECRLLTRLGDTRVMRSDERR
jgi:hypothetical protein